MLFGSIEIFGVNVWGIDMNENNEFYGSPEFKAVAYKASELWNVVNDDLRFQCHGRAVGVNWDEKGVDLSLHLSIARLQGAAACDWIPASEAENYILALEKEGMKTDRYEIWQTEPDALDNAKRVLLENSLRDDLEIEIVSAETSPKSLNAVAELTEICDVTLPMSSFVRGICVPSVYMYAREKSGRPVGHASSTAAFHRHSKHGSYVHWGMLATHPDRRGESIGLILGAMSMLEMNRKHGYENFVTGIRDGNEASEKLCTKLQLSKSDEAVVIAIDPESFTGAKLTK